MHRRTLLLAAATALQAQSTRRYRTAVIGHTGRGNYGHGLDTVWQAFPNVETVAVADPDEAGLAAATARIKAARPYRDYRDMLRTEKPDLVSIGPRWPDQHADMVDAACLIGAHIYIEKPIARDPAEADRITSAVRRARVKLQIAHQMRCSPFTRAVEELLLGGAIGRLQELRARGKEDRRAGGEDLMVLGTHLFDMMRIFAGDPLWVSAHVTQHGEELSARHVHEASESIGPIAGNRISATFCFDGAVHGHFVSNASAATHELRYGLELVGEKGIIFLPMAIYPEGQPYILRSPAYRPTADASWQPIPPAPVPDSLHDAGRNLANALMVQDLLNSIESGRKPACNEDDGRWTIEMVAGVYAAQKSGGRESFPLLNRAHPLTRF